MRTKGVIAALALIVVANIGVLAGSVYNRSGGPWQKITLTERELALPRYYAFLSREDSGMFLQLRYYSGSSEQSWFGRDKLEDLGFDVPKHIKEVQAKRGELRSFGPQKVFVVLEYDGEAWKSYRDRVLENMEEIRKNMEDGALSRDAGDRRLSIIEKTLLETTRLFPIDASLDPEKLRNTYPDMGRYLIVPASYRVFVETKLDLEHGEVQVTDIKGLIQEVLVTRLHLSKSMRLDLDQIIRQAGEPETAGGSGGKERLFGAGGKGNAPRYEAVVGYGKRFEPWIIGVVPFSGERRSSPVEGG
ncbi:MAG: DUF4824 family protein [bacterium]|nr:MAG: DUF4824 family protein [bacterium]